MAANARARPASAPTPARTRLSVSSWRTSRPLGAPKATRTAISLGSNLGDRLGNLQAARDRLRALAVADQPFLQAPIYQTEPVGCPEGSPDFLNTVVALAFEGSPEELLSHCQQIEADLGRVRDGTPNAPRTIDLDLLHFGDSEVSTERLELPHPRLTQRRFVLEPLAEIEPDRVLPGQERRIAQLLAALDDAPLPRAQSDW